MTSHTLWTRQGSQDASHKDRHQPFSDLFETLSKMPQALHFFFKQDMTVVFFIKSDLHPRY